VLGKIAYLDIWDLNVIMQADLHNYHILMRFPLTESGYKALMATPCLEAQPGGAGVAAGTEA
jgi:hypothetical protein